MSDNLHYKGRIYSGCDISVPNASDYSDEGLYEHDLKMFKNYLIQVPSCEYNGLQIEDGVSVEKVNGVWVAITKEQPTEKKEEVKEEQHWFDLIQEMARTIKKMQGELNIVNNRLEWLESRPDNI